MGKKSGSITVKRTRHSKATQNRQSHVLLRRFYAFTNADTGCSDSDTNGHHHDCHWSITKTSTTIPSTSHIFNKTHVTIDIAQRNKIGLKY